MESPTHKLLENHPCVDQIIRVPKSWIKRPSQWKSLRNELRNFEADFSLDPQSLTKSSLLARLSGARTRIGFAGRYGREFSRLLNTELVETNHRHLVDRTLDLASHSQLEIEDRSVEFRLPICAKSKKSFDSFLTHQEIDQFVAINPGAGWESKQWVTKRFGYVARYIHHAFGIPCVVTWAGNAEKQMAESIVRNSGDVAQLAPATSLNDLAALLHRATAFIGCDTGPLHIASAVGTRCVGLHGPTLPGDSGAYGPQHIPVQRWHQNDRNRRKAENFAMQDITVDDVCTAIDQLLRPENKRTAVAA